MEKFSLNTKIQTVVEVADAAIDDELVLMSTEQAKYYSINGVGSDIWQLIKTPITIKELFENIQSLYQIENINYKEQIIDFLTVLDNKKLITVID